ncbi:MAG: flagellar basal body rod protein FlgC [Clostridia bacterium]|nr:flagellar basal body rod protein FlgC [Clostridia bacterium]
MSLFGSLDISASGLTAERLRLDLVANNLANADTTRTPGGGPFRRQLPVFAPGGVADEFVPASFGADVVSAGGATAGVRVVGVVADPTPGPLRYDPNHPDAGPDGFVRLPNVDPTEEMVDLVAASRAYQANVTAFEAGKSMFRAGLDIARG